MQTSDYYKTGIINLDNIVMYRLINLVWFSWVYDISTVVGNLMLYIYIYIYIYIICKQMILRKILNKPELICLHIVKWLKSSI